MYGADKLNCLKDTSTETINCLKASDVGDLLNLQNDLFFFPPTAVIDGNLLTKHPHEYIIDGDINVDEIIIGANQDEGLLDTGAFLVDESLYDEFFNNWNVYGPRYMFGKRHQNNMTDITELDIQQSYEVLDYYTGKTEDINPDDFESITKMLTDGYWYATHMFAELLASKGVSVFQYLFSYKGMFIIFYHD